MRAPLLLSILMLAGPVPGLAQGPGSWRDPDQGCWYVISPQGAVALRYRRDGAPDCPDAGGAPDQRATPARDAAVPSAMAATPSGPSSLGTSETQAPVGRPALPANVRPAVRAAARSFACFAEDRGGTGPMLQRVRIDPQAMLLVVDASSGGVSRTERYTIDTNMDVWLGGRNQRDPRLGFVLVQSRGHLRLDWPDGAGPRAPFRSHVFRCLAGDGIG